MANQVDVAGKKISIGDIVTINQKITEKDHEREQTFEGRVIAIKGSENSRTFTVRKVGAMNIGVERIFPANLPTITKIEVKKSIPVRRAKLYYLRKQI
ncbi:50S ribosomal protein L19 [Candidatus Shapirobacteria bacterium CG03_land_8_20_14_0_80_39_12]|uniref:50S ribosomal protein L19 n=1 Tax=Candidatus Shapirobacteria bacterium CG03_land_8_20_14_0_80_39_12 TaxID=1974879 RepID=A0A2M7BCI2_9BACT|nr:MAG: 50S ribosomal protein L19 [Candidatus Shapirobacteria bacterium CG03_land_8_20_14_0_80_39_12]